MQRKITTRVNSAATPRNRSIRFNRNIIMGVIAILILASCCTVGLCFENPNQSGINKLAEMTALVRHSEACPVVPSEWSAAYLMLLMMAPPMEEEVEEMEHKMLALRAEIGTARWCRLYSVEMEEAYLVMKQAKRR